MHQVHWYQKRVVLLNFEPLMILHQLDKLSHKALNSQGDNPLDQILFLKMVINSVRLSSQKKKSIR